MGLLNFWNISPLPCSPHWVCFSFFDEVSNGGEYLTFCQAPPCALGYFFHAQIIKDSIHKRFSSLASIAENFSKIVTPELNQIWCETLKPLSFDQIAEGTRRCLLECEHFPPIATFRDKAIRGRTLALLNEKSKQPQIENERKGIPMPEKFKELIKELRN